MGKSGENVGVCMLYKDALQFFRKNRFKDYYTPRYDYNIFKVLPTAYNILGLTLKNRENLFSINKAKKLFEERNCCEAQYVILFVIDSLGIKQLEYSSLLKKLVSEGSYLLLSSVFPTITPTAITSIDTGLPPEKHGIAGGKVYIPEIGNLVDLLKLSTPAYKETDVLYKVGVDVKKFLLEPNIFDLTANSEEIVSVKLAERHIARTGLSHLIVDTLERSKGYYFLIDGFSLISQILEKYSENKVLIEFYSGYIDLLIHEYGPTSNEVVFALRHFDLLFEWLAKRVDPAIASKTCIMVFADHGQVALDPNKQIVFSKDDIEETKDWFIVPPGSSGRVLHFYPKPEYKDVLIDWLSEHLSQYGDVFEFSEIKDAYFPRLKNEKIFKNRFGDVVLLLKEGADIVIEREYEAELIELEREFKGHHGSATLDELAVPLVFSKLSNFKK